MVKIKNINHMFAYGAWLLKNKKVKLESATEKENTIIYMFKVNNDAVHLTVVGNGKSKPYNKDWTCTCKHASLHGISKNIMCSHVVASITWMTLREVFGNEI